MDAPLTKARIVAIGAAIFLLGPGAAWLARRLPLEGDGEAIFARALYVWVLMGVPFGVWVLRRREGQRDAAIRNLSTAIEQSQAAVMITDLHSRIQYANGGLCQQIGYAREELIGRRWQDFQQAETPPELVAGLVATVRAGRSWRNEWYNRRKSGELYLVRGCITPVKDKGGRLACFVAIFEDLTEFKRGELAMQEALARAESGERAKERFLATMSHEMRTPLNGISGFTSLLGETELTPEQAEYVQNIRRSSAALIQLTEDILELARIEAGKLKLEPSFCDPGQCVEDILETLAIPAASQGVELLHWVDEGVPPTVLIDEMRLRQVLLSLVGNAVKFTAAGEVEVTVRAERESSLVTCGRWILSFAIRDTGIGIAPAPGEALQALQPGRRIEHAAVSGGGAGAGDREEPGRADGRPDRRRKRPRKGVHLHLHRAGRRRTRAAARPAGPGRAAAGAVRPARPVPTRVRAPGAALGRAPARGGAARRPGCGRLGHRLRRGGRRFGPGPGRAATLSADRAYGIVPADLAPELRAALRAHFVLLLNKPLHHGALPYLLLGHPGR